MTPETARCDRNGTDPAKTRTVKRSVLVVEDEEDIRELVSYTLLKEGYQVVTVGSGEDALAIAEAQPPDLILLDLMLPGIDGMVVCQRLRAGTKNAKTPIVMLTAKSEERDIVAGLTIGANDYIAKPFSREVLMARVRAALRNSTVPPGSHEQAGDPEDSIRIHTLMIHVGRHAVLVEGRPVDLSATEFRVLHFLAKRPGWVFTREQILDAVHGDNYAITPRAIDVQIVGLRRKLAEAGKYIETVRGVGYRLKE
ncbi:MAG: response regulator transcription factor [Thermoguttaceae bacterium]